MKSLILITILAFPIHGFSLESSQSFNSMIDQASEESDALDESLNKMYTNTDDASPAANSMDDKTFIKTEMNSESPKPEVTEKSVDGKRGPSSAT